MDKLDYFEQENEIIPSLGELEKLGVCKENWIMCYPYGAYNNDTLKILQNNGCFLALTTNIGKANANTQPKLELPRLNTNDFPQ